VIRHKVVIDQSDTPEAAERRHKLKQMDMVPFRTRPNPHILRSGWMITLLIFISGVVIECLEKGFVERAGSG
jgi:hypothetical protein